ncbi:MAG: hypothetical protein JWR40_4168 [Massilia sp.]|jgi:hypothetical protein|nr:hypothetical protein [Massilia sp.]MDB5950778.1 hypothetical protein [Massilia sp.]
MRAAHKLVVRGFARNLSSPDGADVLSTVLPESSSL